MCTLVWGEESGKRWICFNRDEQRSRPPADQMALHEGPHGPVAFARDPAGGGTWFAVSSRSFAVGLLNFYASTKEKSVSGRRSRGLLVLELAQCASTSDALQKLSTGDLHDYAPFHVFIFNCKEVHGITWDGRLRRTEDSAHSFWTTSSHDPEKVIQWRKAFWENLPSRPLTAKASAEQLRVTYPDNPAFGTTMDRNDARTVSQIQTELTADGFTISYRSREEGGPGFVDPIEIHYPAKA